MHYITSWIGEIIILILMAVVLELLLPNSAMQRYVRMVVGLLLLLALLKPVLSVFEVDPDKMIQQLNASADIGDDDMKNSIENKKSEIQASNRAYIEEQMAVRMRKQAEGEVSKRFGVKIGEIKVDVDTHQGHKPAQSVRGVTVSLKPSGGGRNKEDMDPVASVDIDASDNKEESDTGKKADDKKIQKIQSFLAKKWDLPAEKISVSIKGGDGEGDDS